MTGRSLLGIFGLLLMATLAAMADRSDMADPFTLDIQAGEPFGDAMARSTMTTEIQIAPDMQQLPLPPLASWNGKIHYQLALQTGDKQRVVIPWTPSGGTIWMNFGVIDEIDLDFSYFDASRSEGLRGSEADEAAADIEAIVSIYSGFQAAKPRPAEVASCYHNRIPLEFLEVDRRDSESGNCERTILLADLQEPDDLRAALHQLLNDAENEIRNDPNALKKVPISLNLGQWWLPNGNLVRLTVVPFSEISPETLPSRLQLSINIREFFRAGLSRLVRTCHDQQAIFPEKIRYTMNEAAQIFHGLYDDFYPPVVDGKVVTDTASLAHLDWSGLTDAYWTDPDTRRGFCELLTELGQRAR